MSSSMFDTKQMTNFLDAINQFALDEIELKLPDPKDLEFESFYQHYKDFL